MSPKAAEPVRSRRQKDLSLLVHKPLHRQDVPTRTDMGKFPPNNCATNRKVLYGERGGHCNGCQTHFKPDNLTVDHVTPRSKGGGDDIGDLQPLCGHCNSVKGDRGTECLAAKRAAQDHVLRPLLTGRAQHAPPLGRLEGPAPIRARPPWPVDLNLLARRVLWSLLFRRAAHARRGPLALGGPQPAAFVNSNARTSRHHSSLARANFLGKPNSVPVPPFSRRLRNGLRGRE